MASRAARPPPTYPATAIRARPPRRPTSGAPSSRALGPRDLERDQLPYLRAGRPGVEVGRDDAEAIEVLGREVDAPGGAVLRHVLPVLGELQRRAHLVGERDPVGCRGAEDVQDELADGVRREVAVGHELVE